MGRKFVQHNTACSRGLPFQQNTKFTETIKVPVENKTTGKAETTSFAVLFHYKYFKTLLLYFKKFLGNENLKLLRKMRK